MVEPDPDALLGTESGHEEPQSRVATTPRGPGWRRLREPVEVEAFVADTWVKVLVDEVNDEVGEIWVRWPLTSPTAPAEVHHQVLSAAHFRPPQGGFPRD